MAFSIEVPGTPEQVWDAIATANGISSWFLPTDVEEHEGGAIVTHMGGTDSPGTITGWDPPRRLEYSEPEWAALTGHDVDSVTPMVTEFLVEAQSGGHPAGTRRRRGRATGRRARPHRAGRADRRVARAERAAAESH
jgi:uncharacterized protein YndB with AHSA1/START domain